MPRMIWHAPEVQFFDTGLDRGVLYPRGTPPIGQILETNLAPDPNRKIAVSGGTTPGFGERYTGSGTTTTVTAVDGPLEQIETYARRTSTDTSVPGQASFDVTGNFLASATLGLPVVAGGHYTISFYLRSSVSLVKASQYTFWYSFYVGNGSNTAPVGAATAVNFNRTVAGTWQRISMTLTVPAGAGSLKSYVQLAGGNGADLVIGETIDATGLLISEGLDLHPFFDGSTPDTGAASYEWLGAENNSHSIKREILSLAVPWIGLTGVDEEGGDGAASYYIDGRPFLFLPRPKEYKATLKAFTYPDAFSEIMGVTEVADGMYLDSQPGEAFDLCYRTIVGNGLQGVDHGYKIHLVYNATVTPQALTYESLSNSINPTTFSWEIQAVPVKVEGFRPTAHIIIDTRHMDQDKIDSIEALLYGGEHEVPHMPSPQVVFDLLSYGDTIIITDNGDGTFDVTGSYENVYMLSDGVFQVDNVDATNNGDGTFTASSTNV